MLCAWIYMSRPHLLFFKTYKWNVILHKHIINIITFS
ncbi:unnamed protein product [Spodoptera exigua]|nr:unnamed protein product [Spodoptera exigua]